MSKKYNNYYKKVDYKGNSNYWQNKYDYKYNRPKIDYIPKYPISYYNSENKNNNRKSYDEFKEMNVLNKKRERPKESQKENDSNDTYKMLYLQAVNQIYKGQKHLNLNKYSNEVIFDCLFKVFTNIKNDEHKKNFAGVFLSYYNNLSDDENKKFIEKYQKYIFEDVKKEEEDENKYNYIIILMTQLMRFKIRLPDYLQEFIIKLKIVNKKDNNRLKKIIVDALKLVMKYNQGSYIYMKENISEECKTVLEEMTKEKTYFV